MDAAEMGVTLRVFEAALSRIKWKLKLSSKRRLQTDILSLCSRMRPCIMVDYGGKMPELRDRLCAFLSYCKKKSLNFEHLNVMVIDDMVYLIHVREISDFVKSRLDMEPPSVLFADIEHDPLKMISHTEGNNATAQLVSAQKVFASVFKPDGVVNDYVQRHENGKAAYKYFEFVDLTCCLEESQITIPTLNGWLLGYPVIYLISKNRIEDAVYNLSMKSLRIYQFFVCRGSWQGKNYEKEELLSFSVPSEISREGGNELWAKSFLRRMQGRQESCKEVWGSLHMEVHHCSPQAIAL